MASKHVDVNERRLRPVYDALDSMNNKKAIQQADKILKKQKDMHCAKVLKSIALLRSGKVIESERLMNEVQKVQPCDEATLQAMTICFKEMEKCSEISSIYEVAVKKNPKNEELYTHLFMSYVRTSQYKKQQQAYVCQDERIKTMMLLPLAEKMIEKFIKEEKIEAEAEVTLYLMVLEMQNKYEKALEVLTGKLGHFLNGSTNTNQKEVEYLSKLEKWSEVNTCCKCLIEKSPDEWPYYKRYLESLLNLIKLNYVPPGDNDSARPVPDHSMAMALGFIIKLKQNELGKVNKQNRGPFLAHLELCKYLQESSIQDLCEVDECNKSPLQLMVQYFEIFGDKNLCFFDLVNYTDLIDDNQIGEIKILSRRITIERLSRYHGRHDGLSPEEKTLLAKHYMLLHKDGLKYGQDLLPTDFQHSDEYALLAAHLLLDCCEKSADSSSLLRILIILESALKTSPSNFQFKLLVSRLYCLAGAVGPCVTYMDGMDVKHIAHDTLGYNITRYAAPLGHFESAMAINSLALKLYQSNQKDTPEYVIASYKYGSFEKIFEMINFKERLENSFTYASVIYEQKFLEIVKLANSSLAIQELFREKQLAGSCPHSRNWTDKLRDNRDLDVLVSWDKSVRQSSEKMKRTSFKHEVLWLRLRVLIIRSLGLAITLLPIGPSAGASPQENMVNNHINTSPQATNGSDDTESSTQLTTVMEELQDLLNEVDSCGVKDIEDLLNEVGNCGVKDIEFPICGPLPSRWKSYIGGSYEKLLLCLLRITQILFHVTEKPGQDDKLRESVELIKKDFSAASRILSDNVNTCVNSLTVEDEEKKIFNGNVVESLVLVLEAISVVPVFVACFRTVVLKVTQMSRSKKKQKMLSPAKKELSEEFKLFVESISSSVSKIHTQLLDEQVLHLAEELIAVDMNELYKLTDSSLLTEIWEKMQTSYKISVQEISEVMKLKLDFIKGLSI